MCFIDTSYSNITQDMSSDDFFILDNLDGSGKHRPSNYTRLLDESKEILHQFKPETFNIIIHSASGGTGSVLSPILVSELTSRNEFVIPIIVGSTSSKIETNNTLKTIQSYATISKKLGLPISAIYEENSSSKNRSQVDNEIIQMLFIMCALFSGTNKELDTADISNFKDYHKVTDNKPTFTSIAIFVNDIIIPKGIQLLSAVTLTNNTDSSMLNIPIDYHAVGYTINNKFDLPNTLHICNTTGLFTAKVEELKEKLDVFNEASSLHNIKPIIDDNVKANDEGIVL